MDFSLFFFAADSAEPTGTPYELLLRAARIADDNGLTAVWTPERHFHRFGGPYPNPALTAAALATVTSRIQLRAGSVVAPLHHPLSLVEDWAVVDNLSGGRVGISLASGWNPADFATRPEAYSGRRDLLREAVPAIRGLWSAQPVAARTGTGDACSVRAYPPPVQPSLPLWLTSSGSKDTFAAAGELGTGVLTHLLGQEIDDLRNKIELYRRTLGATASGWGGHVVLMLHTFLAAERQESLETARGPLEDYLRTSVGLIAPAVPGGGAIDWDELEPEDVDTLVRLAADRYLGTGGLFGTVADGLRLVTQLAGIGVDEIACLIDFGIATDRVLDGVHHVVALRDAAAAEGLSG
jgi:natural product biosynthesis luciferase-like monooxygenase protein